MLVVIKEIQPVWALENGRKGITLNCVNLSFTGASKFTVYSDSPLFNEFSPSFCPAVYDLDVEVIERKGKPVQILQSVRLVNKNVDLEKAKSSLLGK